MVNIEKLKEEIVERLLPLKPEKIFLFGSYANGTATDDSDIDLFLIRNDETSPTDYDLTARKYIRSLIFKYRIGFDILSASQEFLDNCGDCFYKTEVIKNGKLLYAK